MALHCISAGSGVFGAGEHFWTFHPKGQGVVAKLNAALATKQPTDNPITGQIEWLAGYRAVAFGASYPVASELDWGLHLLAIYFRSGAGQPEVGPGQPEVGPGLLEVLRNDSKERSRVYMRAMEPRLLYGGKLTEYTKRVYSLAKAFQPLDQSVPFPDNCKLGELLDNGNMLGPDGKPIKPSKHSAPIPFPSHCSCIKPIKVDELINKRRDEEDVMIGELMGAIGLSSSIVVDARKRAILDVANRLKTDSHLSNLTSVLPPSASLTDAVYQPEVLMG